MNKRKAKKAIKKKWHIEKWRGNIDPRTMDKLYKLMTAALIEEFERAFLYGEEEKFASHYEKPIGIINDKNFIC